MDKRGSEGASCVTRCVSLRKSFRPCGRSPVTTKACGCAGPTKSYPANRYDPSWRLRSGIFRRNAIVGKPPTPRLHVPMPAPRPSKSYFQARLGLTGRDSADERLGWLDAALTLRCTASLVLREGSWKTKLDPKFHCSQIVRLGSAKNSRVLVNPHLRPMIEFCTYVGSTPYTLAGFAACVLRRTISPVRGRSQRSQ